MVCEKLSSLKIFFLISRNFSEEAPSSPKANIFQIEFYQQFFNIDTTEVINRVATSMIYKRAHSNYLRNNLGELKLKSFDFI